MNNHPPRVGLLPDTDLRAHDVRLCEQCQKPLKVWARRRKHCSLECQRAARFAALGQDAPPAPVKEKDRPAPHYSRAEQARLAARKIEARMAYWQEYHRRHRTFRVGNGWEGWRSSLGGDS